MSDDQIIAMAVRTNLGRRMRPIGISTGDVFWTDASYRTDELLRFARSIEKRAVKEYENERASWAQLNCR